MAKKVKYKDTWKFKKKATFGGKDYEVFNIAYRTKADAVKKAKTLKEHGMNVIRDKRSVGHILWVRKKEKLPAHVGAWERKSVASKPKAKPKAKPATKKSTIRKNWRKATQKEMSGAASRGYIDTSYSNIKAKLGEPELLDEGFKSDAEWDLKFKDGTVISIYNYKDGKNYLGSKGKSKSDITDWHVGGKGQVMKHLRTLFPRANIKS